MSDPLKDAFDPNERPELRRTVQALRTTHEDFPWIQPTADEAEVADLLEELEALHVPANDVPDNPDDPPLCRTYGVCRGCGETWPCKGWVHAEQLSVQWLGRAADRVWAHAKAVMDGLDEREKTRRNAA